jgi:hypothetical protein
MMHAAVFLAPDYPARGGCLNAACRRRFAVGSAEH